MDRYYVNMRGHFNLVPRPPVVVCENVRKLEAETSLVSWNETGWNDQETKLSKWYLLVVVVNNKENDW